MEVLKKFLMEYGIVDSTVLNIIENSLSDPRMHECFKDLLQKFNPSIRELFIVKVGDKEMFSVMGLLNAALMSGDVMKYIAKKCLKYLAEGRP